MTGQNTLTDSQPQKTYFFTFSIFEHEKRRQNARAHLAAYVSEKGGEEEVLEVEEFKILAFCACERDFLTR